MRLITTILALILGPAAPAAADVHPRYHEAAKAAAANVVVMRVERLDDHGLRDMGDCTLVGRVEAVERGTRLAPGQPLTVIVPCFVNAASLPTSGIQWQAIQDLRAAHRGRVWLDGAGVQLGARYFQILD